MSEKFHEDLVVKSYHHIWESHFNPSKELYDVYAPPPNEEVFLGFDLGFARKKKRFSFGVGGAYKWLKDAVKNPYLRNNAFLYAYFYQYKLKEEVSDILRIKDKSTYSFLTGKLTYPLVGKTYRTLLDTTPNVTSKGVVRRYSQHETLCRLVKVGCSEVAYCTPKFLEIPGIPQIAKRRLADLDLTLIDKDTPLLKDGAVHYLYFKTLTGTNPAWCSEPSSAKTRGPTEHPKMLSPINLLKLFKANYLLEEEGAAVHYEDQNLSSDDIAEDRIKLYMTALPSCARIISFPEIPDLGTSER